MSTCKAMIRDKKCYITIKPIASENRTIYMSEIKFRYPINKAVHDYDLLARDIIDYLIVYPEFNPENKTDLYMKISVEIKNAVKRYLYKKGMIVKKELKA